MNTNIKRVKSVRRPFILGFILVAALLCAGLMLGLSGSTARAAGERLVNNGDGTFTFSTSGLQINNLYYSRLYGYETSASRVASVGSTKEIFDDWSGGSVTFTPTITGGQEASVVVSWMDDTGEMSYSNVVHVNREGKPLPVPKEKEGHTFVGWYFDEELTRPYDGSPIYADTDLFAKYEINRYTVRFDTDGGEAVAERVVDWNTTLTDLPTPTREGYDFVGWFTSSTTEYAGEAVKADTTLTAHWQIKVFTVTFKVDGEVYTRVQVEWGQSFAAALEAANLRYYNVLNEQGQKLGKAATVRGDVTVPIGEMTKEEKIATFIGNNWWLLAVGGGFIGVLLISLIIAIIVAKSRR